MLSNKISAVSLSVAISLLPLSASAASFSGVVGFGDSLTDSGNVALFTEPLFQTVPFGGILPSFAYESGRFTNGATWIETLATRLGVSASPSLGGGTNFAFGGGRTGPLGTTPPSLLDQLVVFQTNTGGIAASDALYVVWSANNDVRDAAVQKQEGENDAATTTLNQAVTNIVTTITALQSAGAVNILVPNIADLGATPEATRGVAGLAAASTVVTNEYNTLLATALTPFRNNSSLNLIEIDTFSYYNAVFANPADFGLTNTTDPCIEADSVCTNPEEFFFYDGIHPTATVHRQFGEFVFSQVSVPESNNIVGLGMASLLGACLIKRNSPKA
ncbi:MAG: SGNH/GDSL hydrolase family protein [Microcystaceae cyanobacterium]